MTKENVNTMSVTGKIVTIELSHELQNRNGETEKYFRFYIEVPRLSETTDVLPVVVSEKLMFRQNFKAGDYVTLVSKLRTHNYEKEGRNHLAIYGYAENIEIIDEESVAAISDKNFVILNGYVCKKPTMRTTKSGRIITDLLIACNHSTANGRNKSDYIPCIAWGTNAKMASRLCVGDEISIDGRFQSRVYHRKNDLENKENVAYEVSCINLKLVDDEELADKDNNREIEVA